VEPVPSIALSIGPLIAEPLATAFLTFASLFNKNG